MFSGVVPAVVMKTLQVMMECSRTNWAWELHPTWDGSNVTACLGGIATRLTAEGNCATVNLTRDSGCAAVGSFLPFQFQPNRRALHTSSGLSVSSDSTPMHNFKSIK